MTSSNYKKMLTQLKSKPARLKKFIKHNKPKVRKHGAMNNKCIRCGNVRGHIRKYGINLCRRCFREQAPELGFRKYR